MTPPVRIDRRGIGLDSIGDAQGDEFTTDSIGFETTASFLDGLFRNLSASMRCDLSVSSTKFLYQERVGSTHDDPRLLIQGVFTTPNEGVAN